MATEDYLITTRDDTPAQARPAPPGLRRLGLLCLGGGVVAAVGAVWSATVDPAVAADRLSHPCTPAGFRVTEVVWALTHLLTLCGAVGLVRTGFAGRGRLARVGGPLTVVCMALLAPWELAFAALADDATDSSAVFAVSTGIGITATLAGLGFVLLGVAVLRERRWRTWARWTPLVVGLYALVVVTAVAPLSGVVFAVGIAGWNVCLAALGLGLATALTPPTSAPGRRRGRACGAGAGG